MDAGKLAWDSEEALTDLTFYADWDSIVSMIQSLRTHLYEYGTIPTWNFMFCNGRPELAVPYSWAWTWPSLFAYALPPVQAILAVWIAMTLVGFLATRALLLRWSGSAPGATAGAGVYVLSGYFASRFNAGHVTFAFFHWIPLLVYLFDVTLDRVLEGRPVFRPLLLTALVSFLFASGGLPHGVLHFYPALLLFVLYRTLRAGFARGFGRALRAATPPIAANLLGIGLAAYKLWPVIDWQRRFPRQGVEWESYSAVEVVSNTLVFVGDYLSPATLQPWHAYPAWGYNAFVGFVPWLCAGAALAAAWPLRRAGDEGKPGRPPPAGQEGVAFGTLLVAVGVVLSLGNDSPWSPAHLFRHLPILDGIRAFNRYQVLIVFGLAILTANGIAAVTAWLGDRGPWGRPLAWLIAGAALFPVAAQAALLVWNIPAVSRASMSEDLGLAAGSPPPRYVPAGRRKPHSMGPQAAILAAGHWVGDCYSNLTLPALPARPGGRREPISEPPPEAVVGLGQSHIALRYAEARPTWIFLNLRVLEGFEANVPLRPRDGGVAFRSRKLDEGRFTLTASQPAVAQGRWASALGLLATGLFLAVVLRNERRNPKPSRSLGRTPPIR